MTMLPNSAGNYSTGHYMTTCGCNNYTVAAGEVLEFGFVAKGVRIHNTCADPVLYFNLSTELATTGSAVIPGSGIVQIENIFTLGLSLASTLTSTGAVPLPTGRPRISVVAWGN